MLWTQCLSKMLVIINCITEAIITDVGKTLDQMNDIIDRIKRR